MKYKRRVITLLLLVIGLMSTGCASQNNPASKLRVVASTTLVGDVVKQIGGDRISLTVLLPIGADPHTFEPRPQDAAAISDAQIIFLNGLELEHSLEPVIQSNATGKIIEVSNGIEVLPFNENQSEINTAPAGENHNHAAGDPHTWMDPTLVMIWAQNIAAALSESDATNAGYYEANSKAYISELSDLDEWIKTEVAAIPVEQRKLVTDHEAFGYFAHRYGFEVIGLVVASLSTSASPSALEIAALEDTIRQQGVPAIFVDSTANPVLAQQVAQDTSVKLVTIYSGSLGDVNSGIASYIEFMKTNVLAIVDGLK